MRKMIVILTALILAISAFAQPTLVCDQYLSPYNSYATLVDGVATADSGLILFGSSDLQYSLWMLKIDSECLTVDIFEPLLYENIEYKHCVLDPDGYVVLVCNEYILQTKRGVIVKLTQDGQLVWMQQAYPVNFYFNDVCIADNGDYIVVGSSGPPYSDWKETTIWCYDESGNETWINHCDSGIYGEGIAVCQSNDSGYVIAACKSSEIGFPCLAIYEVDDLGNVTNQETYVYNSTAYDIARAADGSDSYIVATNSEANGCIMRLVRVGAELVADWTTVIASPGCVSSSVNSISPNENYILYAGADYHQLESLGVAGKMDNSGNVIWQQAVTTQGWAWMEWCCVTQYDQGYVYVGSSCNTWGFPVSGRLVKYTDQTGVIQETPPALVSVFNTSVSPNPFNSSAIISYTLPNTNQVSLSVYDISGRQVVELVNSIREAGTHSVTFDGSNLASGIYFYRLTAGDFIAVKKMILVK